MARRTNQYTRVNAELIGKVRELKESFPDMSADDMAEFTGWTSCTTISKILRGEYDHMLESTATPPNQDGELLDIMYANNALLADIATMLVNMIECPEHKATKEIEAHFRNRIKANRRESCAESE